VDLWYSDKATLRISLKDWSHPLGGAMPWLAASDGHSAIDDDAFVGRQPELARLDLALRVASSSQPRFEVIEGSAAIGKTALVRRFLGTASDAYVLWSQADELEARLPLAVVERRLIAPVAAKALEQLTAHGRSDPRADPLRIGADLVHLLDLLQQKRPVLLVLDDAQRADLPSLHALTFAVRGLQVNRVLALFVTRDLHDRRLPERLRRNLDGDQGIRLRLDGLDADELRALAGRLCTGALHPGRGPPADHRQGNPLYARATLQELPLEALGSTPGSPLPAPHSFAALTMDHLTSCPPDTQRLVAPVAVLGRSSTLDLAATLAELDDQLPALELAIATRLPNQDAASAAASTATDPCRCCALRSTRLSVLSHRPRECRLIKH
jgi:AAA ATPase domain